MKTKILRILSGSSIWLISWIFCQSSTFLQNYEFDSGHYILDINFIRDKGSNLNLFHTAYNGTVVYVDSLNLVGFIIDPEWNRIVYGNYKTWAKGFGEYGSGNGKFANPHSVSTDGLGNIYVADTYNGRLVKLQYNSSNQEIPASSYTPIGASVLQQPWDLDVDDRGNLNPADDWLWVIDKSLNRILKFSVSGSYLDAITSLYNPSTGVTYNDQSGLSGIAVRKNPAQGYNSTSNRRLYLIDWKLRKLFLAEADIIENGQVNIYREITYPSGDVLVDVESDFFGDVWVVVENQDKIQKRTWDLQYLAQLTGLNRPTSVASSRRHNKYMALTERWTDDTGSRTYTHGAEASGLVINAGTNTANFDFKTLAYGNLVVKVYRGSTHKATLHNGIRASGPVSLNWYQSSPESGPFKLKIWSYAYHDNSIYYYCEPYFSFDLKLTISGPSVLDYKYSGTYTANVTGGSGSTTSYQWYKKYDGSSTWIVRGTSQSQVERMYMTGFTVKVVVTRGSETIQATKHVAFLGGEPMPKAITELPIPESYDLAPNRPNPFNPTATIPYQLPEASDVTIMIYDVLGREVMRWEFRQEPPGYKQVVWSGRDNAGRRLPSGVYVYRMTAYSIESKERYVKVRKMLLLK